MSSESRNRAAAAGRRELTDARAMRALAHPVRISLIELLAHTGTLTATQASEVLGESPTNCAFHLRTLARYGFIEDAGGGHGRERPWRRSHTGLEIPSDQQSPQANQAAALLGDFVTGLLLERARTNLAARNSWPEPWQEALGQAEYLCYLTVAEARELVSDIDAVLSRYTDRLDHPERRPSEAMPVEIVALGYPLLHLAALKVADPDARPPGTGPPETRPPETED